jgi:hypothetical protein
MNSEYELEIMYSEVVVTYFNVLSRNLPLKIQEALSHDSRCPHRDMYLGRLPECETSALPTQTAIKPDSLVAKSELDNLTIPYKW